MEMLDFFQILLRAAADLFRMLFPDLEDILDNNMLANPNAVEEPTKKIIATIKREAIIKPARLNDFERLSMLGCGPNGTVYQVKHTLQGGIFALKVMHRPKTEMQKRRLKDEICILQNLKSKFLCEMFHYFKTEAKVYFVFEYLTGGDIYSLVQRKGRLSEEDTRFYLAEVALGLEFLHSHKVVHRDLKPENLVLDVEGHVKIIDFGFCKILRKGEKTKSFIGTTEFLAPESFTWKGYDHAVDLWAFGVVLYTLLTGNELFPGGINADMNKKNFSEKRFLYNRHMSVKAKDLLDNLLKFRPLERITLPEMKQSSFFQTIDWEKVETRQYKVPYIPNVSDECDISQFDEYYTRREVMQSPQKETVFEDMETHTFGDFDANFDKDPKKKT